MRTFWYAVWAISETLFIAVFMAVVIESIVETIFGRL
jgi:hypothetical protein